MSNTPRTDAHNWNEGHYDDPLHSLLDFARQLERELNAANDRIKRLEDCVETAWGIIANVDSGSWGEQRADWREAVIRWRDDQFHPELSERKAKEAKP